MKKIISIFIAIITISILTSCKCHEQREMERMISQTVDTRSFTGFDVYSTTSLSDEVEQQLTVHKSILSWHSGWYEAYSEGTTLEDSIKAAKYRNEMNKDKELISLLESIDDKYPDIYNEVSFTTYMLTYLCNKENGSVELDACFAKYDQTGNMVAFKPSIKGGWTNMGNICSIPGYEYKDYKW